MARWRSRSSRPAGRRWPRPFTGAAAFAVLLLFVVLVPYRRGEVWSWWAIAAATVVGSGLIVARVVFLPTTAGAGVGWTQLGVVAVALLLDAGRLRKR